MRVRTSRAALAIAISMTLMWAVIPGVSVASTAGEAGPARTRSAFSRSRPTEAQIAAKAEARAAAGIDVTSVRPSTVTVADAFDHGDDDISGAIGITAGSTADRTFATDIDDWDVDWFSMPVQANHTYVIAAVGTAGDPDPVLTFGPADGPNITNDDTTREPWDPNSLICYTVGTNGTYYIAVADWWREDGVFAGGGSYQLQVEDMGTGYAPATSHRMPGADRYEVARNVGLEANGGTWAGIDTVLIASGLDAAAADALTASSLAGAKDAPILLINQASGTKSLPGKTKSAISAIESANPGVRVKYYLVGGTGSVPSWVQTRISEVAGVATFERLSGADRYACSARIASELRSETGGGPATCFVANGETTRFFFDALAAAPVSHAMEWPILLCRKNSVPGSTNAELANYSNRYVVGNTYEVSTARVVAPMGGIRVGEEIDDYYDRAIVARHVAELAYGHAWLGRSRICVANKLADALTGGTLAGSLGGPLLFVSNGYEMDVATEAFVQQARLSLTDFYMIGGTASIDGDAEAQLLEITGHPGAWYTP